MTQSGAQLIHVAGLGCRRDCSSVQLFELLQQALAAHGLQPADLNALASSSHKQAEPGLRQLAEQLSLPIAWLPASQLSPYHQRLRQTSALSLQITGSAGVAEASALAQVELLSGQRGELLGEKLRSATATCALARAQLLEIL
ncbi:cobalamin biosynthesis protein [Pseudomonas sp.]|uniref:cobalamin biosynthesis protein n=1 Tax=Pseudomonas sp. TaxID=306 RepID=UPI003C7844D0